jgi:uncharacterized membrane protein
MNKQTYQIIKWFLLVTLLVVVGWSIYASSVLVLLLGMVSVMLALSLIRLRVDGLLADERQIAISQKAARVSFNILLQVLALTSLALFVGGQGTYYYVRSLGIILGYVTCLGLLIYVFAYFYLDRKTGG